jgi:sugar phosphate isomerase/epimerase
MLTRRSALKHLALAGAALPLLGRATSASAAPAVETKPQLPAPPLFKLGVATVTLKGMPLDNALAAVKRVGLDRVSLFRSHSPWENVPAQWAATAQKIKAAGVTPACCGVLYLKNNEPEMRRMLDYVRALGAPLFSCSPEPSALPLLERLVKEYDLRAAIHNHGPEDKVWPSPAGVWQAVGSLDSRIGLCLDVGHSYRAGADPVDAIRRYRSRLYDIHVKDTVAEVGKEDIPVEIGRGRLDLPGLLKTLIEIGYSEHVWFEYEKDPNDPLPGLAESVGYIRGLLKGLSVV